MNFGSEHVYLYDSSDEEYIPEEELSHGIELSLNISNEEPRPKPRPLPGYGVSRSDRSTNPPLRDEIPQLISAEDVSEGSTTKYLCDQDSDEEHDVKKKEERQNEDEDTTVKPSEGAAAVATPATAVPLPKPPAGILKTKPKKRHIGGMVQWMSWHDSGDFKYILKKYQPSLAEGINLPDLIPQLNCHGLLTDEENEALLDSTVPHKERVLKLLSFVEKKNTILYHNFLLALEDETNHDGHRMLARMLRRASEKQEQEQHRGIKSRQVDTNILALRFDTLGGRASIHTGDVVVCKNDECAAVLSHLSKVTEKTDSDKKAWVCEFCGTTNEVDIVAEEMPTSDQITYLLTPPPVASSTGAGSATPTAGIQESLLVFCIDTSGSMCVTTEVAGKVELKSDEKLRRLSVSLKADIESQYMPRQSRNVTYISRLQSVQAAIDDQLTRLVKSNPSQRVALITFNDEVFVMGDGRSDCVTVAGDKLLNVDALLRIGGELPLPASVSHSKDALVQKVSMLEEGGQTALGPALLLSVLLAGQVPGSKVIVCTDGLANTGLGSLDEIKTEEAFGAAQQFYQDLGEIAVEKGVTVSVVTIKGTECRVMELGQVADATGGNVTRVDPSTVATEFSNIVSNPVIATNVACKLILHNQLYFRTEVVQGNVLCVPVGNVTADTELSYEYGVKKAKTSSQKKPSDATKATVGDSFTTPPLMIGGKPHLPFQLQTEYTTSDGSVLVRVITKVKPVTEDRKVAERDIDMDVMGFHALRTSANLAAEGKFTEARTEAIASKRLMKRSLDRSRNTMKVASYKKTMSSIAPLEKTLREKQKQVSSSSLPMRREVTSVQTCPPRFPTEPVLKSAFDKSKSLSTVEPRASNSLRVMSIGSSLSRRSSSIATASLTSREEAATLRMASTDALAAEIYRVKSQSSSSKEPDSAQ